MLDVENEAEFKKLRNRCITFIILALAIPTLAAMDFLNYFGDSTNIWFQRSGSLMVFAAVIAEFYVSKMRETIRPADYVGIHPLESAYSKQVSFLNGISIFLALVGTLIWGYGDIPYA